MHRKSIPHTIVASLLCLALILPLSLFPIPAEAAGVTVYVYQDITTNTTWEAGNTYVICEVPGTNPQRGPKVMPGVTLTIESGATVALDSNREYIGGGIDTHTHGILYVHGNINATGAIFTARTDKWQYLVLEANDTANLTVNATFTDCIFEKGGYTEPAGMIMVEENVSLEPSDGQTVNLTIDGCTFRDSFDNQTYGIKGMGICSSLGHYTNARGTFSFTDSTFTDLGGSIFVERNADDDIDVTVDNCTFNNCHGGVGVESGRHVTVTDSRFSNIGEPAGTATPVEVGRQFTPFSDKAVGNVTVTGNTFTGTSETTATPMRFHASTKINAGIESPGNTFPGYPDDVKYAYVYLGGYDTDAVWGKTGLPYLLDGSVKVGDASGSLTIDPGVTVTMTDSGGIDVYGSLNATGTAESPIHFNTIAPTSESNYIDIYNCKNDVTLKHCVLDGMQYGIAGGMNHATDDHIDSLTIENCTFKNMVKTGLSYSDYGNVPEGNGVIKNSVFENNGEHGFAAFDSSGPLAVTNCIFRNNAKDGISLKRVSHMTFDHCLIHSNGQNGVSLEDNTDEANAPGLVNCTIANNEQYGILNKKAYGYLPSYTMVYGVKLHNTISSNNEAEDLYNRGYVEGSGSNITYSCITTSWMDDNYTVSPLGTGSIRKDALFADPENDDFHLKSDGGRYNGTAWVTDTVTSQCVDAGDPASGYANEPAANGGRINMGYYGNTDEASKARVGTLDTEAPVWADEAELSASGITSESATISWDAVADAVKYRVFKAEELLYDWWVPVKTLTGTSCPVTDDFDRGYTYKVEVMDAAGNWSDTGPQRLIRTPDNDPPVWEEDSYLNASNITATSVRLNWSGAGDARDMYLNKARIYRNGSLLAEINYYSRPYTATGLSPSTTYTFKVEACDASANWSTDGPSTTVTTSDDAATYTVTFDSRGGSAVASRTAQADAVITVPANPTRSGYTFGGWYKEAACTNAWNFSSDKVTANTTLYAKWNIKKYTVSVTVNSTSYGTVSGGGSIAHGTTATVKAVPKAGYRFVRWLEGAKQVSASASYSFAVTKARSLKAEFAKIGSPALTAKSSGYNSIKLTWTKVTGAKGYALYRATSSGGTYSKIKTLTGTSYTNTGLTTGKTYYYKVRAYCVAGSATTYGSYSSYKYAKPVPATPTLTAKPAGYNSIKLAWTSVSGRTGYALYRATSKTGKYSKIKTLTGTSYTNTGLTTGKTYYYKVRAYRKAGSATAYGSYSSVKSAKPVPATATLTAKSAGYNGVRLTWTSVPGRTGYALYRATSKTGKYTRIKTLTGTSYTNTGLTTGKTYYFKVRAYRKAGSAITYGSYSSVKSAKPVPSKTVSVKAARASSSSIKLTWGAVSGAARYQVYRATSKTGKYSMIATTSNRSYTNKGLKTGKYYYYKVRAYRSVGSAKVYGSFSSVVYAKPTAVPKVARKAVAKATRFTYVYKSSTTSSSKLLKLGPGNLMDVLGTSGSYYKVVAAGKTGYVPVSHVSIVSGKVGSSAKAPAPTPKTTNTKTVGKVVNCNSYVNVRSGPGTSKALVGTAPKGAEYPVKKAYYSSNWHQIEYKGKTAYIHKDYLKLLSAQQDAASKAVAKATRFTYVYKSSTTSSSKLLKLGPGNLMDVLGTSGSYYKVVAAGKTGYVPISHVSIVSGSVR
jgi:uncharacterized repeat protein (TIGR02543 family)